MPRYIDVLSHILAAKVTSNKIGFKRALMLFFRLFIVLLILHPKVVLGQDPYLKGKDQLGIITVDDSLDIPVYLNSLVTNIDLRDECRLALDSTQKKTSVNNLLKKMNELISNGQQLLSFNFHDLDYNDSTFFYWDTIKKIIKKSPDKHLNFNFGRINYLPLDFFDELGSVHNIFISIQNLCYKVDCQMVDPDLISFGFAIYDRCSNGRLVLPKYTDLGIAEFKAPKNITEMPTIDSITCGDVTLGYQNFKNLKIRTDNKDVFSLNLIMDTSDITIDKYILNYSDRISFIIPFKSQKIRIESDGKYSNSRLTLTIAGNFNNDGEIVDELIIDSMVFKFAKDLFLYKLNIESGLIKNISANAIDINLLIMNSKVTFDMDTIRLIKKFKEVEFNEVKFINKTAFTLEEIKNQLPNCTFN